MTHVDQIPLPYTANTGGDIYFIVELLFLFSEMTWNKVINNNI